MTPIFNESGVELTWTVEEFREFNETIVQFKDALDDAFKNKIPAVEDDKEYFNMLQDDFAHFIKYMYQDMLTYPAPGGLRLVLDRTEYDKFQDSVGYLRSDLTGFQDWFNSQCEYEKADALDELQDLLDIFIHLMGYQIIKMPS